MSYRVRLGRIKKSEVKKFKNKSYDELFDKYSDSSDFWLATEPEGYEELTLICSEICGIEENYENFYDFDLKEYTGNPIYILNKKNLEDIIEKYSNSVKDFYNELYLSLEKPDIGRISSIIMSKKHDWDRFRNLKNYYITDDKTDFMLTPSGSYEYMIFNLVNLYRLFDWENDFLIYSGW